MNRLIGAAVLAASFLTVPACAQSLRTASQASEASLNASEQAAQSVALLTASGVQATFGVVAVPLGLTGAGLESTGASLRGAGEAMWDGANTPIIIDEDVVVAAAPPQVPFEAQAEPFTAPAARDDEN